MYGTLSSPGMARGPQAKVVRWEREGISPLPWRMACKAAWSALNGLMSLSSDDLLVGTGFSPQSTDGWTWGVVRVSFLDGVRQNSLT